MPRHCPCPGVLSVSAFLHLSFFSSVSVCLSLGLCAALWGSPLPLTQHFLCVAFMFALSLHTDPNMPCPTACCQVENELVKQSQTLWVVLPVTFVHSCRRCLGLCPKAGWQRPLVSDQHQLPLTPWGQSRVCCRPDSSTVRDRGPRLSSSQQKNLLLIQNRCPTLPTATLKYPEAVK